MITCIDIFTWFYSEFNKPAMCNNFHIAILLHAVLLHCLYEQSSAHISFLLILFLHICVGRLKHNFFFFHMLAYRYPINFEQALLHILDGHFSTSG